ncbi:hypothetical protein [Phenylobacterium sp.]|uniref:hypothetical protein n=1 Tax=Phenylobacterium sp. TaxID=1871053 RepID=UPI00286E0F60|nr:hypothetical protein [Phenylobacterium sp.]
MEPHTSDKIVPIDDNPMVRLLQVLAEFAEERRPGESSDRQYARRAFPGSRFSSVFDPRH